MRQRNTSSNHSPNKHVPAPSEILLANVNSDQDVAIKNDGETSEHIETFGRLGAYEEGAGEVRAEVRVQPQKPQKEPKRRKRGEEAQTSLFDF